MTDTLPDWIQESLSDVHMVEWDRFAHGEWSDDHDYWTVYGWIDREDEYKDYVQITFWSNEQLMYTTSSDEYTEDIHQLLFDEPPEEHNSCQRVEHASDIGNVIEL